MANIKEFLQSQAQKRSAELEEIAKRLTELAKVGEESENEEELKAANAELDELKAKKDELEKELAEVNAQIAELDKPAEETAPVDGAQRSKLNFMKKEERGVNKMNAEERKAKAEEFVKGGTMAVKNAEVRAMLVSSGKIATPTGVNETINELDKTVSSVIDIVDVQDCSGMGANTIPYEYTAPVGGVTVEGETYAEGDTVTDFVETKPTKVTTISYISEETRKLTPVAYEQLVKKNALIALKKKVSAKIMEKLQASELCVKKTLTKIDEKTLRAVALNYGADESVQGNASLLLNKNTLVALGDVRGSNEKKAVYEITPDASNPNTGIIKDGGLSVKYILNSNLADNALVYGQGVKFELDLYSDYDIKVSEDFKFDKGLLAIRGSVMLDGAVTYKDGFIVATVGAGA
jgi:HK97 family phage major capsid protein